MQRAQIVLGIAASEAVDPLQLDVDVGRVRLVDGRLDEAFGLSHLPNPRLDGHELIASAQVHLSELIVIVAEATAATFHLLNLCRDLSLLLSLALGLGSLAGLFGLVSAILFEALVSGRAKLLLL